MKSICRRKLRSLFLIAVATTAWGQIDSKSWGKNSPNITLVLHEGPRQNTSQGTLLLYNLIGRGFPGGVAYELWGWKAGKEPQRVMEGVSFDSRGVLVCSGQPHFCKGNGPDDPINIQTTAAPGEAKRFAVVSPDGKIAGYAEAVPIPANH